MFELIIKHRATVIINHIPNGGLSGVHDRALIDDVQLVKDDLLQKATDLEEAGLPRLNIVLDPGIGFGKSKRLNQELLAFAALVPQYMVMIGYSRKRFLGKDRMETAPNLAAGKIAIDTGAAYLRVHDVATHAIFL